MTRPLDGITVLDLSHAVAGPHCTHQLRLLGAEIIKVEKPGTGDDLRQYVEQSGPPGMSGPFVTFNSGKKSLSLDLKAPASKDVVRRLAERADVVVENYRPGVAAKLGVGWEALKAVNPRLIYCSISGFGSKGPISQWPAYDHVVQAMSGLMSINGEEGQEPLKVGIPITDVFSGYLAAFAILAALYQRVRSDTGQYIDVSMLDATLLLMNSQVVNYMLSGKEPPRTGNAGFRLVATAGTYRTRDGHIAIGANHPPQLAGLFKVLGVPELLQDPRFDTHAGRVEHGAELSAILKDLFASRSAEELELELAAVQVPASMVRTLPQVVRHEQLAQRGTLIEADVPAVEKKVKLVGSGFQFEHDGPAVSGQVPAVGQHSDEILQGLGYGADQIGELRKARVV